jgi:hypothetical protein
LSIALPGAHHQPHVGHPQQQADRQNRLAGQGLLHHQGHQERACNSQDRADGSPNQASETDFFQTDLEINDATAQHQAAQSRNPWRHLSRMEEKSAQGENQNEKCANKNKIEPHDIPFRVNLCCRQGSREAGPQPDDLRVLRRAKSIAPMYVRGTERIEEKPP